MNLIKTVKCKLEVPEKVKLILHDTLLELQSFLVKKPLVFTYSQGTLVIGGKEEVTLTAQIPSRQVSVTLRDWQVVWIYLAL